VIAQHLDPNVPSHLGQILARRSALPVRTLSATTSEPLAAGTIYVVPANTDVEISDGTVQLRPSMGQRPVPSIDRLFTSAAKVYGERVIAVVLTGSGSDGTAGAYAVKAAGGTVLIENPQTASFPTMPASLPPTSVDGVVDLEHLGPLLADLVSGMQAPVTPPEEESLLRLLAQVRQQTGIDFTQYKSPTIVRRLHRRVVATGAGTLPEYLRFLAEHPEEYNHLIASFLINVTEFLRDPAVYAFLRERILPDLLAHARSRGAPYELRIWSAGCSTGEEPYSVAILLAELLGPDALQYTMRIFATDVDADAVAFARRGRYSTAALASVSQGLRARYFTPIEGGFEIVKAIRGMVIFGEHDLGQRAPFPRMDLVLCRNVLIYFTEELQRRVLQLFAFSLLDGGYLVLGNAESAGALSSYFGQVHPHFKVYRRQGERALVPPLPLGGRRRGAAAESPLLGEPVPSRAALRLLPHSPPPAEGSPSLQEHGATAAGELLDYGPRVHTPRERFAEQILGLPMGVVVVDRNYDVLTINSAAYTLLDIYRPAIGKDFLHLAERVPTKPLRAAIDQLFAVPTLPSGSDAGSMVSLQLELEPRAPIEPPNEQHQQRLQITGYPYARTMVAPSGNAVPAVEAVVLFFSHFIPPESPPEATAEASRPSPSTMHESELAKSLRRVTAERDAERARTHELEVANQELRDDNDRLRHTNEDLEVTQEEVQASSEEVKTLNEEMQATNEELETLNEELEATIEELHTTNDDLAARAQELHSLAEEREAQRRASEREGAQLAAVLAGMSDAVLAVDPDGGPLFANDRYQQLFGHQDTAALEDEFGQPLPPAAAPWQRVGEEQPFHLAFTRRAPDESRQWFEGVWQPSASTERQLGGVLTIRDISEHTLRSLYEQFLAQVGHELAQPLTALAAVLYQMQKRLPATAIPAEDERLGVLLATALRQARQLNLLVRDLADLTRIQQEKLQLRQEPVDLVALAARVVDDIALTQLPEQSGPPIVVRMEPNSGGAIRVFGDPMRLEQVLRNLLLNARKYAPESERIDVRIRRIHERATPEMAELEVQDYGPGIPAVDLPFVFMPLYQVSQGTMARAGGLGLGLYVVQQLVQAHGGQTEVRSPAGQGTVFTIRLPTLKPEQQQSTPDNQPSRKREPRHEGKRAPDA
jgi:two-component system CheB/CheR fusion protein